MAGSRALVEKRAGLQPLDHASQGIDYGEVIGPYEISATIIRHRDEPIAALGHGAYAVFGDLVRQHPTAFEIKPYEASPVICGDNGFWIQEANALRGPPTESKRVYELSRVQLVDFHGEIAGYACDPGSGRVHIDIIYDCHMARVDVE